MNQYTYRVYYAFYGATKCDPFRSEKNALASGHAPCKGGAVPREFPAAPPPSAPRSPSPAPPPTNTWPTTSCC